MDHRLGQISLVNWQRRKTRRAKAGGSGVTLFVVAAAAIGLLGATAQAVGWIHLPGLLASAPAALVLVALCIQLILLLRALLSWISG